MQHFGYIPGPSAAQICGDHAVEPTFLQLCYIHTFFTSSNYQASFVSHVLFTAYKVSTPKYVTAAVVCAAPQF